MMEPLSCPAPKELHNGGKGVIDKEETMLRSWQRGVLLMGGVVRSLLVCLNVWQQLLVENGHAAVCEAVPHLAQRNLHGADLLLRDGK